jgi:aminoglycoside 3-N-acetyltransferase I
MGDCNTLRHLSQQVMCAVGSNIAHRYRAGMATAPISIRQLQSGDVSSVRGLNDHFAEAFEDIASYKSSRPSSEYLELLLQKPHVIALVAETNGAIVDGLVAYQLDKFEQERSEIYIYDLAVSELHRRNGVATALIECLREWGVAHGAWVVYVQADYGDEPAIALYTKLGVREHVMHFDIDIKAS